jgi:hypothetical protein
MAKSKKTALPTNDAWTGMLAISLLALIAGCVLLFLDWNRHSEPPKKFQLPNLLVQDDSPQPDPGGQPGDGKKDGEKK